MGVTNGIWETNLELWRSRGLISKYERFERLISKKPCYLINSNGRIKHEILEIIGTCSTYEAQTWK